MKAPKAILKSDLYKALDRLLVENGAIDAKDDETTLADVLTDLMYWADRNKVEFQSSLQRARNYRADGI